MYGVARQLLGDVVLQNLDANRRVSDTYWHRDCTGIRGVRFAFFRYLVDATSGAFRFIPCSHRPDADRDILKFIRERRPPTDAIPAVACPLHPTDVLLFDLRSWHSTWGGGNDRLMCSATFWQAPRTDEERADVQRVSRRFWAVDVGTERFNGRDAAVLDEQWVNDGAQTPLRARLIEDMRTFGVLPPAGPA